jgi:hypothetical protein
MQWDVAPIRKLSFNSNVIMHNKIILDELYSNLDFLFYLYNKNTDVLYGIFYHLYLPLPSLNTSLLYLTYLHGYENIN